jgi:PleD family two-component response regulator
MAGTRRTTTAVGRSDSNSLRSPTYLIAGEGLCQEGCRSLPKSRSIATRILLLDHDQTQALTLALQQRNFQVTHCTAKHEILRELRSNPSGFDVVMLDFSFNRPEDWELFDSVRRLLWKTDHLAMILCFSRVYLGPRVRLQIERKGGRLVYVR